MVMLNKYLNQLDRHVMDMKMCYNTYRCQNTMISSTITLNGGFKNNSTSNLGNWCSNGHMGQ